jgi:hypothetical protein
MAAHIEAAMTTLTDFTTYDEIRAVLGVSDEELEDATLALPIYSQQLGFILADISTTLEDTYNSIKVLPTPTAAQSKLLNVTQVFSAYAIAKILLTSATLFAPRKIGDGRAEVERVSDPFAELRDDVTAGYLSMKQRLEAALAAIGTATTAAVSRTYSSASGLPVDSVTGA